MDKTPAEMRSQRPRIEFQIRAADPGGVEDIGKMIVEGRAIVFEQETVLFSMDGVDYKEVIDRNALAECDMRDVPFKYNHSDNVMIMGRTRNKTLQLTADDQGLMIRCELADTTAGRDLHTLIKRGDIDKMSFAFTVSEESYNKDAHMWRVQKIKRIYDVSAVDLPAYDSTSISARSDRLMEIERRQSLDRERQRKRLLLLSQI